MSHATLTLAGAARNEEEFVTELRNVPNGWLGLLALAVLAAVCTGVVWMYRREGRIGSTVRTRTALAAIRCLVIVCLAIVFLEPVRVRILRRWIDSYTLLLLDDSSSMDLQDRYTEPSQRQRVASLFGEEAPSIRRGDLVQAFLQNDNRSFLRRLASRNRVKVYAFADEPRELVTVKSTRESMDEETAVDEKAEGRPALATVDRAHVSLGLRGPSTNIERSMRRAIDSVGTAPLAGIIVVSDGGFNQGAEARDVAELARQQGIPIYTVGIGDSSEPQNLRVADVQAPPNAFQDDPFEITARISGQGMGGKSVSVELHERSADAAGAERVVAMQQMTIPQAGSATAVSFTHRREQTGRFVYSVRVPLQPFETVADDNEKQVSVRVIDSKTKVLLISGGPSWDYRYLSRLLERDDTFDVACWLESADLSAVRDGNTVLDHMPRLPEEIFAYDVILLIDPDENEFDNELATLLDTFVTKHGGGLLYTAARAHTPDFVRDEALAPLLRLLPVVFDPEADLILNRISHYQLKPAPIVVPETAYAHPILQLADDVASTRLLWQQGYEVYWHYPVLRPKPVATVLLGHGDPRMTNAHGAHVLAAVQYVAAGRTAFVAMDGTWRWRRLGTERYDRFWVQMVRYLAEGKLLGASRRGTIITDGDQFPLGTAVTVSARLYDSGYEPVRAEQVIAAYKVEGDRGEFVLRSKVGEPGWFEGTFLPERPGSYSVSVSIPDTRGGAPTTATKELRIARPNLEILRPQMHRDNLVALADGSDGGKYFNIDEASALPELIPDLHEEIAVRSRPQSLWDNAYVLAILVVLLGVEWSLRKWNRLL